MLRFYCRTRPVLVIGAVVISLTLAYPHPAAGQIAAGEQVRVESGALDKFPDNMPKVACDGIVSRIANDTTVVQLFGKCAQTFAGLTRVLNLQVERDRGSRLRHFAIGLGLGILAGGLAGRIASGDGCKMGGCDEGEFAVMLSTVAGGAWGGILGGAIGLALPAGSHWMPVPRILVRFEPSKASP